MQRWRRCQERMQRLSKGKESGVGARVSSEMRCEVRMSYAFNMDINTEGRDRDRGK